ncbi:MAG: Rieske (2Fe-2S) protein [Gammaproteobacteria bacterium]|nr:Rieske (2Fe-2S) protein [Gammaproteobacteria bacterium]
MSGTVAGAAVCTLAELAEHGARGFSVGEGDWPLRGLVVALPDGGLRAYFNSCPHAGHPLDLLPHRFLTADRRAIVCSSHGALFEPSTGRCIAGPCPGRSLRPLAVSADADGVVRLVEGPMNGDNPRPAAAPVAPSGGD